jgi:hypothetical protein
MKNTYKSGLILLPTLMLLGAVSILTVSSAGQSLSFSPQGGGVVDKARCNDFTVRITFKNTGSDSGTWFVNIAFEGNSWNWKGSQQVLTLNPGDNKTLVWNGSVPAQAPADSMARLVVYYGDSYRPLNWWIHVTTTGELTITASTVD